jgi:sterol desaturase/sphingolipid hydroxylase (fatty acid hydroxylase superfamily)
MYLLEALSQAFLYLGAISLVFVPLEYFWRADKPEPHQRFGWLRKAWFNDLIFYFGQLLFFNALTIFVLSRIFSLYDAGTLTPAFIRELSLPVKIALVILLSDLLIYWGHRAQHRFGILWRFHRVHHTARHVDYLAAYREHPLDNIYTRGIETLPAVLIGLDLNAIAGFITFRGLWALFIHSNVTIRLGFVEAILGSPHLHHWHHELSRRGLVNYANLSPLMDIAFGTYYNPPERPAAYGTADAVSDAWHRQMIEPFYRR